MKKTLIIPVVCFAMTFIATAQETDWKKLNLRGKVKSMTSQQTYRYKQNNAWRDWEKTYRKIYNFNSKGYYETYQEYGLDGKLAYTLTYKYLPKEKKTELTYVNSQGVQTARTNQLLDATGRMIEEIKYHKGDTLYMRYVYTYNEKGARQSMTGYKPDGKVSGKSTWTYDASGKSDSCIVETPGYASSSTKNVYDAMGNIIENTLFNGRGAIEYRYERDYDDKGNKITERTYKGGDVLRNTTKWRYEFDKAGNWIKRTESTSDGMDFHIEERTITYF